MAFRSMRCKTQISFAKRKQIRHLRCLWLKKANVLLDRSDHVFQTHHTQTISVHQRVNQRDVSTLKELMKELVKRTYKNIEKGILKSYHVEWRVLLDNIWRHLVIVLVAHLNRVFAQMFEHVLHCFALEQFLLIDVLACLRVDFAIDEFAYNIDTQGFAELKRENVELS